MDDSYYTRFLSMIITQYIHLPHIEEYIKNYLIDYKHIFETELIIKFLKMQLIANL